MARSRPRERSGGTPATLALERAGVPFTPRSYAHDPNAASYGMEAAEALGVEPRRVLKTLLIEFYGGLGVGIVPADSQLDLKAIAATLGSKRATMADPQQAERATGYVVGGISPIGQKKRLPTVIDESARAFTSILLSGGKRGLDIELAPDDLARLTGATWAAIAR